MIGRSLLFVLGTALVFGQTDPAARGYDKLEGRWNRILAGELIRFADPQETTKFLDYGSATGAVGNRLAVRFPAAEVAGIDTNAAFVAWANSQAPRVKVRFQTGDLVRLPFRAGEFDGTFSIGGINRAADTDRAATEMRRVTKPEGVVAAAVWNYGPNMQPLQFFWNAATAVDPALTPSDGANTPFSKKGQLEQLWNSVGLRDVTERAIDVELSFRNFEDYWSAFVGDPGAAGQWLAAQPEAKRNAVRERLRARVLGSRADGPFTLQARAWAVRGVVRYK